MINLCVLDDFQFDGLMAFSKANVYLSRSRDTLCRCLLIATVLLLFTSPCRAQSLEDTLKQLSITELASIAKETGDASRGAVVFFQHQLACGKCHTVGKPKGSSIGPDLTALGKEVSDESLVESVLFPSKIIRKGFESVNVITADGRTLSALLVEHTNETLLIRDIVQGGEVRAIPTSQIDEVKINKTSIMPAGQVNQLNSQQQFFDLIRYLIEIRDGGESRALQLQPPASLLTLKVPEYEQRVDHKALISNWNKDSLGRGKAIYQRVCANCHGTKDKLGSLPTSLRFAEGKFKNGSDPLSMYRTMTFGFGLMAPQSWMVPTQKYDVIHYIRETYLKPHNQSQFVTLNDRYLDKLPEGDTLGPEPSKIVPWSAMDYGPSLAHTYEVSGPKHNIAYKGIAVRLDPGAGGVSRGRHWIVFDTDTLRTAAAWNGSGNQEANFIDWQGIQFNGAHGVHPRVQGQIAFANSTGPGWSNPTTGEFTNDGRVKGRDGQSYGPLPGDWAKYRGMYHHGLRVVFSYTVGTTEVLESPRLMIREGSDQAPLFLRTFNVGPRVSDLLLQIAEHPAQDAELKVLSQADNSIVMLEPKKALRPSANALISGFAPRNTAVEWISSQGHLRLKIPAGKHPLRFTVWLPSDCGKNKTSEGQENLDSFAHLPMMDADVDLSTLTKGGPARWPQKLETQVVMGSDEGPFASDVLQAPKTNPWLAQTRFTGLDFFRDGRLAVCSWDGDVWLVEMSPALGPEKEQPQTQKLRWQRIATGLFQPLGLKIVDETIHVTCRDQLVVLHDLNNNGETDFYQCLNNDHQVTEHFHEFAMGLQTDVDGNFYYAKSARHALPAVVPHHGTLLKVSKDGSRTEILANGFRAANGVCLNQDGSFFVTDQEGHWNPKNRINWVTVEPSQKPKFYGNMFGYHDVTDKSDSAMVPPLCWITNSFDRSPAELLWVESDHWGPLKGSLLNLSYGYGKAFVVPHEIVAGNMQGGMVELPIPTFPTGVMRGRFHPMDQQLYLCGMFAWAGNATQPGGLYRLRATGKPMNLPIALNATKSGMKITFTDPLDPAAIDLKQILAKTWSLKRTSGYGSKHYDEKSLAVLGATMSNNSKTISLEIRDIQPTWCMEIKYSLRSASGSLVQGTINNTIHKLAD